MTFIQAHKSQSQRIKWDPVLQLPFQSFSPQMGTQAEMGVKGAAAGNALPESHLWPLPAGFTADQEGKKANWPFSKAQLTRAMIPRDQIYTSNTTAGFICSQNISSHLHGNYPHAAKPKWLTKQNQGLSFLLQPGTVHDVSAPGRKEILGRVFTWL